MAPARTAWASLIRARAALPGTGCVSAGPAISDRGWGPWSGRKAGAVRVNFAQSRGVFSLPLWSVAPLADGERFSICAGSLFPADGGGCWGG